jgi:hypothetical protein
MTQNQHFNRNIASKLAPREIQTRKNIIDWLCSVGEQLQISSNCIHKSIVYIDVIMAENNIAEHDLQPLALVCLLIAGKLIEKDCMVMKIVGLLQKRMNVTGIQIRKYEMQVLSLLHYDPQCVTPVDFLQFFASQGLLFSNDKVLTASGFKLPNEKIASSLRKYTEFFADMCLQEYSFLAIDSLHLSAAIIAASRKALKIEKVWTNELCLMTSFKYGEISMAVDQIFTSYNKMFPSTKTKRKDNIENIAPQSSRLMNQSRNGCNHPRGSTRYV